MSVVTMTVPTVYSAAVVEVVVWHCNGHWLPKECVPSLQQGTLSPDRTFGTARCDPKAMRCQCNPPQFSWNIPLLLLLTAASTVQALWDVKGILSSFHNVSTGYDEDTAWKAWTGNAGPTAWVWKALEIQHEQSQSQSCWLQVRCWVLPSYNGE